MHFVNRLHQLPASLHFIINVRLASTFPSSQNGTVNPFPYPSNPQPTPYQIFHLTPGVSQTDIKKRCMFSIHLSVMMEMLKHRQQTTILSGYITRIRSIADDSSRLNGTPDFNPYQQRTTSSVEGLGGVELGQNLTHIYTSSQRGDEHFTLRSTRDNGPNF